MEPILRPDLTRVVLTGSESVGKTTLAQQLASHYGVEYVPEFVREYAASKGSQLSFADHGPIARGQMALENEYAERATSLLIQDTDLTSTVVYCEHYFGRCPQFIIDLAMERRANLYLLPDVDIPWHADGVRDRGDRRDEMQGLFRARLAEMEMPVVVVSGDGHERFQRAVDAVDALLLARR